MLIAHDSYAWANEHNSNESINFKYIYSWTDVAFNGYSYCQVFHKLQLTDTEYPVCHWWFLNVYQISSGLRYDARTVSSWQYRQ